MSTERNALSDHYELKRFLDALCRKKRQRFFPITNKRRVRTNRKKIHIFSHISNLQSSYNTALVSEEEAVHSKANFLGIRRRENGVYIPVRVVKNWASRFFSECWRYCCCHRVGGKIIMVKLKQQYC